MISGMGGMSDQIRVLLADDHAIVRSGVTEILNNQPGIAVVAQASDGAEAVELYQQHHPDVALIDLRMPRSMVSRSSNRSGADSATPSS